MALKSIKCDKSEMDEYDNEVMGGDEREYPYGTCLELDRKTLEKLGISTMPVGFEVMITAKAKVERTSESESEDYGKDVNMSLQITDMDLVPAQDDGLAERMYGGKGDK